MALRRRNRECGFCRASWSDERQSEYKNIKFKKVKALALDENNFGVYLDSFFVWSGPSCCACDAKLKALNEIGVEKFLLEKK
jgi:hypothetical protein